MHPSEWANQAMEEGRYTSATKVLPTMMLDRMIDEVTTSISLIWIKKGLKGITKKVKWGPAFQGKKKN
jgi:hypothetical protein